MDTNSINSSLHALLTMGFWSATTIGLYLLTKALNRRYRAWWNAPLLLTPLLVMGLIVLCHGTYREYIGSTHWLVALLGPATVAFAIPIYEQRALIRRHWPILLLGGITGSATAILSAWGFATLLGLDSSLRLSLLPRSVSTPFAMAISGDIGGQPDLTAVFVVLTGVLGAALGEALLYWLPLRSALARGALFGMGAHGAGVAKAHGLGREEGSIAGLVMVFVGLINVVAGPWLAHVVR